MTFRPKLCGNCAFPQNLYPRILGETAVFSAVKATVKTFDITDCETNNCNANIAQYLKKYLQSGNEIWSVNEI